VDGHSRKLIQAERIAYPPGEDESYGRGRRSEGQKQKSIQPPSGIQPTDEKQQSRAGDTSDKGVRAGVGCMVVEFAKEQAGKCREPAAIGMELSGRIMDVVDNFRTRSASADDRTVAVVRVVPVGA
jgi:hypothetical protein